MNLPSWSDTDPTCLNALKKIKNDLPERITREVEWFQAVIKKIQEGLEAGAKTTVENNPVGVPPTQEQIKSRTEGFEGTCSPGAVAYLKQKQIADEAATCTPPDSSADEAAEAARAATITVSSEIARINGLLDNSDLKAAVSKCNGLMTTMLKLQSDLEKLKAGELYEWQRGAPSKSYPKFQPGGDRTKSFLFSMKQNQ